MRKKFIIKGYDFEFSGEDVKQAVANMDSGTRGRVRFYTKIEGKLYPVRQLLVEMAKQKGVPVPDATTHEGIRVLRSLGFEITEV